MNFEIDSDDKIYKVGKRTYILISLVFRTGCIAIGFWLGSILYYQCLQNPSSNTFVIIYIGILSLACFQAAGLPVARLINLDLIKS